MALVKCHECEHEVSTDAKACPNCGAIPRNPGIGGGVGLIAAMIATVWVVSQCTGSGASSGTSAAALPTTPPADPKKEARFRTTVLAAASLKQALRNPDSVAWEDLSSNEDGSIVCIQYRAQNGFGGMNREYFVYAQGKTAQGASSWNKHCTKQSMYDMAYARHALK